MCAFASDSSEQFPTLTLPLPLPLPLALALAA